MHSDDQEKRQRRTKRNRFHPPGGDRRLARHRPSAKSAVSTYRAPSPATVLPRRDKVVGLLDKIRNNRHGNPGASPPHWGPIWTATSRPSRLFDAGRKPVGDCMRRSGLDLKNAVLRHLAVAGLALLIGSGGVFAQSGTPAPDQPGKPPAANSGRRHQGQPAQDRRIRRGLAGHQRPGRQPGMRLARPPRGPPDVAGRPRYRLPAPRPLRPVRLPRRPRPGHLPLPDPLRRPDRPQGRRNPVAAASMPAGSIRAPSPRRPRRPTRLRPPPPAMRRPHPPPRPRRPPAPPRRAGEIDRQASTQRRTERTELFSVCSSPRP